MGSQRDKPTGRTRDSSQVGTERHEIDVSYLPLLYTRPHPRWSLVSLVTWLSSLEGGWAQPSYSNGVTRLISFVGTSRRGRGARGLQGLGESDVRGLASQGLTVVVSLRRPTFTECRAGEGVSPGGGAEWPSVTRRRAGAGRLWSRGSLRGGLPPQDSDGLDPLQARLGRLWR